MRMPVLTLLGHVIALWMIKKRGAPLWDLVTGYRVPGKEITGLRIGIFVAALVGLFMLSMVIIWPELEPLLMEEMAKEAS